MAGGQLLGLKKQTWVWTVLEPLRRVQMGLVIWDPGQLWSQGEMLGHSGQAHLVTRRPSDPAWRLPGSGTRDAVRPLTFTTASGRTELRNGEALSSCDQQRAPISPSESPTGQGYSIHPRGSSW